MRTCIVTREKISKRDLVRFIFDKEAGVLQFDKSGKGVGRGANLSKSLDTFDKAVQIGAFSRNFKLKITQQNSAVARDELKKYLEREQLRDSTGKVSVRIDKGSVKLG